MDAIVPWACTEEWKKVHRLIYSGDVQNLQKGFEMMRGWKSRCTKLHAGLECTFLITEALLTGQELGNFPSLRSPDAIASCYAMALTRFLNLASTFEKERACYSMYKIARRLNLPEWIVNLRHQSAHGHDLPSAAVLETGLILALDWLDKEYWKRGLQGEQWEISGDKSLMNKFQMRLSRLTKAYQELKMLRISAVEHKKEVESVYYTSIMNEFLSESDGDWMNNSHTKNFSKVKSMPLTLRKCILIILKKFLEVFKAAEKECFDIGILLDFFIKDSLFLPNERNIEDFDPHPDDIPNERLPRNMILMWNNMLEDVIFKAGIMVLFIQKLINFKSTDELSNMWAAIWVKQIALSIKSIELVKSVYTEEKNGNSDFGTQIRPLVAQLKQRRPAQMWNLVFMWDSMPVREEFNSLVEDVIRNPRENSLVYIRELLELHSETFSSQRKSLIVKAIKVKLELQNEADSVKMLHPKLTEIEKFCEIMTDDGKDHMADDRISPEYEHKNPTHNWENIPLALYPWHHQQVNIPFQIPGDQEELVYLNSRGEVYCN